MHAKILLHIGNRAHFGCYCKYILSFIVNNIMKGNGYKQL